LPSDAADIGKLQHASRLATVTRTLDVNNLRGVGFPRSWSEIPCSESDVPTGRHQSVLAARGVLGSARHQLAQQQQLDGVVHVPARL